MTTAAPGGVDTRTRPAFRWAIAVLVAWNVLNNRVLPTWSYVPVNLIEAGVLVAIARWAHTSWDDLGLDRRRAGAGLRWGLAAMALVIAVYLVGLAVPGLHGLFASNDAKEASFWRMLYESLIRIPLGTVVLEEVAFRGVLLALGARLWRWWPAAAVSSALFGLWHVLPSARLTSVNLGFEDVASHAGGQVGVVVGAVLTTFVAGLVFCWLRRRSGSLLAPALLHVATNSWGLFFAWLLARNSV